MIATGHTLNPLIQDSRKSRNHARSRLRLFLCAWRVK